MKLTNKIKKIAKKIISLLPDKQNYHSYKYTTSVNISKDINLVIKDINKNKKIVKKVVQNIH